MQQDRAHEGVHQAEDERHDQEFQPGELRLEREVEAGDDVHGNEEGRRVDQELDDAIHAR